MREGFFVRLGLCFVVFAVVAKAQVDSVPPPGTIAAEQDYVFAYGLFQDSLYQLAAVQFAEYLQKYPSNPKRMEAAFFVSECYFRLGQYNDAIRSFNSFVNAYPREKWTADAYVRLGESHLKLGRNAEAVEAYKVVLERFGDSPVASDAAYWVGEAAFRQSDFDLALKYYELAYENRKAAGLRDYAAYSIGWVYQIRQNYQKAAAWFGRISSEFPGSPLISPARIRLAECRLALKEYPAVLQVLGPDTAGLSGQDRGDARFLRGEAYYGLGEYRRAREEYELFLAQYPGHRKVPEAQYALAWTFIKLGDLDAALTLLDELVRGDSDLAEPALFRRGVVENLKGDREKALESWQSVVDRFPKGSQADNALYESALLRYNSGDFRRALTSVEELLQAYPESDVQGEALRLRGECFLALGRFREAHESFQALSRLAQVSSELLVTASFQSAWSLHRMEDYAGSAAGFSKFLDAYPLHPQATDARFWRAEARYRLQEYLAAAEDYRAVAGVPGSNHVADALYGLGWSQYKLGNYDGAIGSFEKLLETFPQSRYAVDARLRLADSHFFLKQYDRAAGLYRSVLRTVQDDSALDYAQFQLAQTYYRLGDRRSAVSQYEDLIKKFPNSPLADDAQYAIGWMHFQEKEYPQAIAAFQKTVAAYAGRETAPRAVYSVGDAYYNLGKYEEAEKAYRRVLSEYPASPFVVDAIGGIQYCRLARGDQAGAVQAIDEFLRQNPASAASEALKLKKGEIYFSQKDYGRAVAEYDAFLSQHPSSSLAGTAEYWAAKSLRLSGQSSRAADRFLRVASLPGASAALKAQALLEAAELRRELKDVSGSLAVLDRLESDYGTLEPASEGAYLRALILEDSGDLLQTVGQLERNLTKYAGTTAADRSRIKLSTIFLREGNVERSLALATAVATSRTDELGAEAQYIIGTGLAQQGKLEEAITAFLKVRYVFRRFDLWMAKTSLAMGEVYERLREPQRARESYRRVLSYEQLPEIVEAARERLNRLDRR